MGNVDRGVGTPLEEFRRDVIAGLGRMPKTLPSRWLYDDAGSALFERITTLREYYPTRTETAILRDSAPEIADYLGTDVELIEYGAGAAIKTEILLDALEQPRAYLPVDIAGDFLDLAAERIREHFPALTVYPVVADFTSDFSLPDPEDGERHRVGFFPGSTIGNLDADEAGALLRRIRDQVGSGGQAVIGLDLIKDRGTLLRAYDDRLGVTAAFNRNLLVRINRELDGSLPVEAFRHEARWNDDEQAVEMHLICRHALTAEVAGQLVRFESGESIHTETSRKYALADLDGFVGRAGWRLDRTWTDENELFAVLGLSVAGAAAMPVGMPRPRLAGGASR